MDKRNAIISIAVQPLVSNVASAKKISHQNQTVVRLALAEPEEHSLMTNEKYDQMADAQRPNRTNSTDRFLRRTASAEFANSWQLR